MKIDFVNFTIKGERYPLIHTISELRYRVFSIKMGINSRDETRVCSNKRNFGIAVPKDQIDFCMEYDSLVEIAKTGLIKSSLFQKILCLTRLPLPLSRLL